MMDANEYQQQARRTSATDNYNGTIVAHKRLAAHHVMCLLHGSMGLCTEAGELQGALKKHVFYGAELDLVNIAEECGDLFWYLAETLTAIDRTFVDTMEKNLAKLRERYPDKFNEQDAVNRDLDAERKTL